MSEKQKTPLSICINAINLSKTNVFRDGLVTDKDYSVFTMNRIMAHSPDVVLFANDINVSPGLPPRRHFEFMMHTVSNKNRWTPYVKPKNAEFAEFVMTKLCVSRIKAEEYLSMLSTAELEKLKQLRLQFLENSTTAGKTR